MADVEFTSFREEVVTELDEQGRVVRSKGRLPQTGRQPTNSSLATAIHQQLDSSRHNPQRGAGGGKISVSIGKVTVEKPKYNANREATRLVRELTAFK